MTDTLTLLFAALVFGNFHLTCLINTCCLRWVFCANISDVGHVTICVGRCKQCGFWLAV